VETLLWRARRALHRELTAAGYERRALVSLPVAGWAYRRLGSIRARIDEWGGHRLAPVLGSAASVVTIGALVIGTTGSGAHPSRPQPLIAAHAPSGVPSAPPPTAPTPAGVPVPSAPSVSASLPAAPAVPPTAAQVAADGRAAVFGATFTNAGAASYQAGQAPVHASVAGVAAGLDPNATASGLATTAAATADQVRRSIP
jgi:Meckel syndrome type 1 protein